MRKLLIVVSSVFLSLFIFSQASAVTTYKWVDEEGNMVYSQTPPAEGITYEKIKTRAPSRNSGTTAPATSAARDSILKDKADREIDDLVENETAKNEEIRKKNCQIAKKNLTFYQVQRRWKDEDGNIKSLTDSERKKKLEETKENVKNYCD